MTALDMLEVVEKTVRGWEKEEKKEEEDSFFRGQTFDQVECPSLFIST